MIQTLLILLALLGSSSALDVFGYPSEAEMLSFTNYKRRSFSYTIGTCYDFGGLWFEQPTTSTPAQIFADSSCKVVVHVINITACEQNTALKMTYYPPSAYGSQDAEFQAFYNDGRKYFNFAIPSNCLNKTIVRFQPTVTKDDREIAVLTVDYKFELEKQVNSTLQNVCIAQIEAQANAVDALLTTQTKTVSGQLQKQQTSVESSVSTLSDAMTSKLTALSTSVDDTLETYRKKLTNELEDQLDTFLDSFKEKLAKELDEKVDDLVCAAAKRKRDNVKARDGDKPKKPAVVTASNRSSPTLLLLGFAMALFVMV